MVSKLSTVPQKTCSTREVANMLGISVRTAQLWVEDGRLTAWKTPGGHRRILRESVEKLLEQQRRVGMHRAPGQRVLLLDDDQPRGEALQAAMSRLLPDGKIEQAESFVGLVRTGEFKPDVIVADLDPAAGFNLRVLQTLMQSPVSADTLKILLVESEASWEPFKDQLEPHFLVLVKPVEGRELASVIRTVLPIQGKRG